MRDVPSDGTVHETAHPLCTATYHRDGQGGWWSHVNGLGGYTAVGKTLDEVRQLTAEGITFCVTDGASTEPARSIMFMRHWPSSTGLVAPNAQETFACPHCGKEI